MAPVPLMHDGLGVAGRGVVVPERFGEGLVVAQVHNSRAVGLDAVAQRHCRMMQVLRDDPRATDLVRAFSEFSERDGGRKLADLDGEVSELHLAGEDFAQRMSAPFWTADRDLDPGNEERGEEGKALDVIPVRVAKQNRRRDGLGCVRHELRAERAGARPAVKYEAGAPARRHSHTRGVAAETDGARARRCDRPPGAPESYSHTPSSVSYSYSTWRPSRYRASSAARARISSGSRRPAARAGDAPTPRGLPAPGRLLQGSPDLRNPVQAVAGAGSLHVVAQDANVFVIRVFERCSYRRDVPPSVLQETGNQLRETRAHPDADASYSVLFDGVQERRFADGFGE